MALTSIILACLALAALFWPGNGVFMAMAMALPALVGGVLGYRNKASKGWNRLAGAGAIPLSLLALILAWSKWAVAQSAIARLRDFF